MNNLLLAAGAMSLFTCGLHVFAGGPTSAGPLLAAKDLHDVPKFTQYYCWHIVSLVLLAMALCFVWAARDPAAMELAMLMTALAGAFALWSVVLVLWKKQRPLLLPQWALFIPITLLGMLGMLG